jgi:outer membrane protein assembly factor BamB
LQADWTQFRYDAAHTGHNAAERTLRASTVGRLRRAWSIVLPGQSLTSPTVASGRVFTTTVRASLRAYSVANGRGLWVARFRVLAGFGSAPAASDKLVSIGGHTVRTSDGTRVWGRSGLDEFSPTVAGGRFYSLSGHMLPRSLVALSPASGKILWSLEMPAYTFCFFCAPAVADRRVFGVGVEEAGGGGEPRAVSSSVVIAHDAGSGKRLWRTPILEQAPELGISAPSSVAVADGLVFVAAAVKEHDLDRRYAVLALDAVTGDERWRADVGASRFLSGTMPAVAAGIVFYASPDGYLYALRATNGRRVWRSAPVRFSWVDPAVAGGVLYAARTGEVRALDAATGRQLWRASDRGRVNSIVIASGALYVTRLLGPLENPTTSLLTKYVLRGSSHDEPPLPIAAAVASRRWGRELTPPRVDSLFPTA